jgi:hypothetical protein
MGFTAINVGDEFLSAAILNEVIDAIRERQTVLGMALTARVAADDDVQTKDFWIAIQQAVEELVPYFTNDTIGGGDFSALSAVPMFTLGAWRVAAGIHADGFTAVDDAGTDHRLLEADDFINKHLVNELQAGLSLLLRTYTVGDTVWDAQGETNWSDASAELATEVLSKAAAILAYDAGPYKTFNRVDAFTTSQDLGGAWRAIIERSYAYFKWTGPTGTKDIDFYARADQGGADSFNGNGDFPVGYTPGMLYLAKTVAVATGTTVYSAAFGKGPPGNYPDWPSGADLTTGYDSSTGTTAPMSVVKWDFVYV